MNPLLEEWHCTLRGPIGTEFEGGLYHFRILLPAEYPFRPPSLMMLTPNGRFELNTKICISFTSYHEELWQPAWGVRTAILGLHSFFPLKGQAAVGVGSIETPIAERKRLATLSRDWVCPHCQQPNLELLPDLVTERDAEVAHSEHLTSTVVPRSQTLPSDSTTVTQNMLPPTARDDQLVPTDFPELQHVDTAADTHSAPVTTSDMIRSKHPVVLDTVICVLVAMAVAMICRRVI